MGDSSARGVGELMSAGAMRPLCAHCHEKEVSRPGGKFCSRACSALGRRTSNVSERALETMRRVSRRRAAAAFRQALAPHQREDGYVPAEAVEAIYMRERKVIYERGYGAGYKRGLHVSCATSQVGQS